MQHVLVARACAVSLLVVVSLLVQVVSLLVHNVHACSCVDAQSDSQHAQHMHTLVTIVTIHMLAVGMVRARRGIHRSCASR